MSQHLQTAWSGDRINLHRGDELVDSVGANEILRVIFVYRDQGQNPGDMNYAVVELANEHLIFPATTGFAGRVLFEHQAFWDRRACVYWVSEQHATLPGRLRGGWFLRRQAPAYARLPRTELDPLLERWPLQGPQTWEQRKWERIQRSRPFADMNAQPTGHGTVPEARKRRA